MVSECLKAFKSFKNLKSPWREFLDQESKAKNRAAFEKKNNEVAVPIFSRKLDAFEESGTKNHTPQKRGVIGELQSSKNMLSCRPEFYWHCQLNSGFVLQPQVS
jgi:hypothetical protein